MTDQSAIASLLATARVRFISVLVVIALVLGIASEGISISINYYTLKKLKCDLLVQANVNAASVYALNEPAKNHDRWKGYAEACLD